MTKSPPSETATLSLMPIQLPPSLQRERHTVDKEVEWARSLMPEQRLAAVFALSRDALTLLAMNEQREKILAMRDPVPESTRLALRRLRQRR